MTIDELRTKATISLYPETTELLGISKNSGYSAATRGDIETLRIGGRIVVPVAPLLRLLGIEDAP